MARRSKIAALPKVLRGELDQRLADGSDTYSVLASWLAENGHSIARSSIARYIRKRVAPPSSPWPGEGPRQTSNEGSELLTDFECAALLGVTRDTLADWRRRSDGPPYCRITKTVVRYLRTPVIDWLRSRLVQGGAPISGGGDSSN